MMFKLHAELKGSHVHVRVFAGPDGDHQALCGELRMLKGEYIAFRDTLCAGVTRSNVEVLCKERPSIESLERRE